MNYPATRFLLAFLASLIGTVVFMPSGNTESARSNSQCPAITVECPSSCPKANEEVIFRAHLNGGDSSRAPKFNWSVTNGRIVSGQGTPTLTERIENNCNPMTATVYVEGLAPGCPARASCATVTDCCMGASAARKLDEFGDFNCEDEMARLDGFAVQLGAEPGAKGYVIFYGGRSYRGRLARRGEAEARANRIKRYLLERRGIDAGRIVMINGGYRERWGAELWITPAGAQAPTPRPTLGIKDMKFRRGKIRKGEYDCDI